MIDHVKDATITQERCGLLWIEFPDRDDETGGHYTAWLLVHASTDRVLVTVDGPIPGQICYAVSVEGSRRLYVSLEGAKRNAFSAAMQILGDGWKESAQRRKQRRTRRVTKSE